MAEIFKFIGVSTYKLDKIMATQEESAKALSDINQQLIAVNDQLKAVGGGVSKTVAEQASTIEDLKAQLSSALAGNETPSALQSAIDAIQLAMAALAASAQALSDMGGNAPQPVPAPVDQPPPA